ncbi:hypothetical protein BX661DRAFT_197589 [Kickxella alabastrina]|uniref:uncharacterized protein n=1 Tax=Kickxella alabastrina TaxID=61397 RepID=UPI00221ED73E|nr:uncharacterized protein BX661DRAFT_197589 [Kickxella alabastrina]KAI7831061.1 hypothetical protein BX661DRAFT_197589 [Kickxella alabastrina]
MRSLNPLIIACLFFFGTGALALNLTGETALLDAAPTTTNRRHATAVTFGELGVFDFRGNGHARVALSLGAFSSEKKDTPADKRLRSALSTGSTENTSNSALASRQAAQGQSPVRTTESVELDHVYLIFAKARAVNNFVARLHTAHKRENGQRVVGQRGADDETAALMLCSDVGSWLESEFVAPISALRRPAKKTKEASDANEAKEAAAVEEEDRPKISFIAAATGHPTLVADGLPRVTKVTGMQRRGATPTPESTSNSESATTARPRPSADAPPLLLGADSTANDVFLVEYEWEWLVQHGGEYAVVIANCAATTMQFKYNLIMANRGLDGQWTNLPAGWIPVQRVLPAVSHTLWALSLALWAVAAVHAHVRRRVRPVLAAVVGFVPVLRLLSSLADQSRMRVWGAGAYEVTMVAVSTSLVDALADGTQLLALLALSKGWGVVRARLAGTEKRLVPGLVVFVGVATLYDGATRGGGVLAVGVLQMAAAWYACASMAHTRRAHAVQTLRLVSRNETALARWWATQAQAQQGSGSGSAASNQAQQLGWAPAVALQRLAACSWACVAAESASAERSRLALVWSAVRKERLLRRVHRVALPLQCVDVGVLLASSFAVPPHRAFVGLLLVQAAHWAAFMAVFLVLALDGLELPDVLLPPLPAIAARRSIPLPPTQTRAAAAVSHRPMPPLGHLRLLRSATPFAATG